MGIPYSLQIDVLKMLKVVRRVTKSMREEINLVQRVDVVLSATV